MNLNNINSISNNYKFNQPQCIKEDKSSYIQIEPVKLHNLLKNSIDHILSAKSFFCYIKGNSLKKMEFEFLRKDLAKNGIDINKLFKDSLDCLRDIL